MPTPEEVNIVRQLGQKLNRLREARERVGELDAKITEFTDRKAISEATVASLEDETDTLLTTLKGL